MLATKTDLCAIRLAADDVGDYSVTESGWYAVDDGDKVVLGPFTSLAECDRAIRDRLGDRGGRPA
jgi:hypothetical protein